MFHRNWRGYHRGEINFELKALIFYNIFNALNNKSLQKKLREQCLFGSSKKVQILTSRRISRRRYAHEQLWLVGSISRLVNVKLQLVNATATNRKV